MKPQKFALVLGLLGFCVSALGCKDDDPCDPDQTERDGQCYPRVSGGSAPTGAGGDDGGSAPAAGGSGAAVETAVGTPCEDTTSSSDCGEPAPICADLSPLGQSIMCTQIDCGDGEANAGVCPKGFTCFAPPGYPSVCIKE